VLASSADDPLCRDYHRSGAESFALCRESDRRAEVLFGSLGEGGYVEYACPHGLREIAMPLSVEGVHWGTLFIGQFLYDDDAVDEAALALRARRFGWNAEKYAAAFKEARRFSRERIAGAMGYFGAFGKILSRLAYGAFRTRALARHGAAAAADAAVSAALEAKDRLYTQLQHRIKNSLALISSLLSIQAGAVEQEGTRRSLDSAQARVRSVGILYEQLYKTRSVESIDLGSYLEELVQAAVSSIPDTRGINLEADSERINLGTDRAVAVGLAVNELAINAARHAFPPGAAGIVRLGLRLDGSDVVLDFQDDGSGLPEGFRLDAGPGVGSLLISSLAVQLGGTMEIGTGIGGRGAGFCLRFPVASRKAEAP
jgi:two-component sensor histidine kinase